MKKLLVTAIGAAAALGAFAAGEISLLRFEGMERGGTTTDALNTAQGTYWSADADATNNTYAIEERVGTIVSRQTAIDTAPTNALSIKTTFGKPLSVNVVENGTSTNIPNSGIYFDSLVKFTVCEDEPVVTNYDGAKIVMWLQEEYSGDDIVKTNLVVAAGYLTGASITNSTKVYVCGNTIEGDFAEKFHRVTIKAIADITNGQGIPGFAIYIDGNDTSGEFGLRANCTDAKWDADFTYALTEAAQALANANALFPSMVQQGGAIGKLTAASFDGTGAITDIIFTDVAPSFAKDYASEKVSITIGDTVLEPCTSLEEAVETLNGLSSAQPVTATFKLLTGVNFEGPLTIENTDEDITVVIDLDGKAITNTANSGYALILNSPVTITDSSIAQTGAIVSDIQGEGNGAIYVGQSGSLELLAGTIDGYIERYYDGEHFVAVDLKGGTVKQNDIEPYTGYTLVAKGGGFYDVVELVTYTITFEPGTGATVDPATTNYTLQSSAITLPTPETTVLGVEFGGWTNSTITEAITTYTPAAGDGNFTLYAKWDPVVLTEYTITFDAGAGATVDPASTNYTLASGAITLPTAVPTGFGVSFGGWTNATYTTPQATYTPAAGDGNFTFYAKWDAVAPCTITLVPGRNDATVSPSTINFWAGQGEINLPDAVLDPEVVGVTFAGWTNDTYTTAITNYTPPAENAASFTLYAKWDMVVGPTYPSYIDTTDSTIVNQYNTWKTTYSIPDGNNDLEKYFLLNVSPQLGESSLNATAVTISGTTVTIAINHGNLNGYPYVKKAATVAGLSGATPTAIEVDPADGNSRQNNIDNGGIVELENQSGAAQFYQIGVQSEPVAVPNP